ncbi:MAG: hypothetical protein HKN91_11860 [Acidimicrobiia bacterium]|nr:hypothetical protein [Acidimicrobiia bacterium]
MKQQETPKKAGDRGRWYFQVLGIETDGSPTTLQEVARTRDASRTTELVTGMWDETAELPPANGDVDPLADWTPTELSSKASSKRNVRWPVVVFALAIGIAAGFALWWLPQASEQRATAHADLIADSLSDLYGDLGGLQDALAIATEPTSAVPDLGTVGLGLGSVADSAARLLDVANESAPNPLPLSPEDRFRDLDAFRIGLEPMAAEAIALRSEVAEIAEYRLALGSVMAIDALPLTADSSIVAEQTAALSKVLIESVAALDSMPTSGPFAEHRNLVDSEVTAFAQWQDDYLTALRDDDPAKAGELVEQLELTRSGLSAELVVTLATLRTDIDGRILDLAERLARSIAAVPR